VIFKNKFNLCKDMDLPDHFFCSPSELAVFVWKKLKKEEYKLPQMKEVPKPESSYFFIPIKTCESKATHFLISFWYDETYTSLQYVPPGYCIDKPFSDSQVYIEEWGFGQDRDVNNYKSIEDLVEDIHRLESPFPKLYNKSHKRAARVIQEWFRDIYYSPHTKLGKSRLEREWESLFGETEK